MKLKSGLRYVYKPNPYSKNIFTKNEKLDYIIEQKAEEIDKFQHASKKDEESFDTSIASCDYDYSKPILSESDNCNDEAYEQLQWETDAELCNVCQVRLLFDYDSSGMYHCPKCHHIYDGNAQCTCTYT